jgi:hypothetical protein
MMKKKIVYKTFILSGLLMIFSCSQDAIFYNISQETLPEKPHVPGHPTNMVEFKWKTNDLMYVASGNTLHWYREGVWCSGDHDMDQPGGRITGLAVASDYLYALCLSGSGINTVLKRIKNDGSTGWVTMDNDTGYKPLQTIYADNSGHLFAGAGSGSDYGILYLDSTTLKLLQGNTEMLTGAASDSSNYYLSTKGKGVYSGAISGLPSTPPVQINGENHLFMGMIKLPSNKIIVVKRDGGALYEVVSSSALNPLLVSTGKYATGALAVWKVDTYTMLVAGVQGALYSSSSSSSYTNGYVEFIIDTDITGPNDPTITANPEQYRASLGKHPINHLHQASNNVDPSSSNKRYFASTQSAGLWSYKPRTGGPEWNAEN